MNTSKRDKLQNLARDPGATEAERRNAAGRLRVLPIDTLPAVRSEEADDTWAGQGVLTRTRNGTNAHLRGSAFRHFLLNIKDGIKFTNRTVPLTEEFGTGDFYLILSWGLKGGLVVKTGSSYEVPSTKALRTAWNVLCDGMKL